MRTYTNFSIFTCLWAFLSLPPPHIPSPQPVRPSSPPLPRSRHPHLFPLHGCLSSSSGNIPYHLLNPAVPLPPPPSPRVGGRRHRGPFPVQESLASSQTCPVFPPGAAWRVPAGALAVADRRSGAHRGAFNFVPFKGPLSKRLWEQVPVEVLFLPLGGMCTGLISHILLASY